MGGPARFAQGAVVDLLDAEAEGVALPARWLAAGFEPGSYAPPRVSAASGPRTDSAMEEPKRPRTASALEEPKRPSHGENTDRITNYYVQIKDNERVDQSRSARLESSNHPPGFLFAG